MSGVGWSCLPACDAASRCDPGMSSWSPKNPGAPCGCSRRSAAHALIGLAGRLEHSAVDELRDERHRETATETAPTETTTGPA